MASDGLMDTVSKLLENAAEPMSMQEIRTG